MYTHLHNHSYYSLLDGLPKPALYAKRAKELGQTACALTDHGVLYGTVEFYKACKKEEIKPIIGCEMYVTRGSRFEKQLTEHNKRYYHLVLLAKNNVGYENLMTLVSRAHLEGYYYKPRIDYELMEQYKEGIIALSACLGGEMSQMILSGAPDTELIKTVEQYQYLYGKDSYFLEVQDRIELPEQRIVNDRIFQLAKAHDIPTVLTCDCHYVNKEDKEAHDIFVCIQTDKSVDDETRLTMKGGDYSMRSEEELMTMFPDHPEVFDNTSKISDMIDLKIGMGVYKMPLYEVPADKTPEMVVRERVFKGASKKYQLPVTPEELDLLIEKVPFSVEKKLADLSPQEFQEMTTRGYSEKKLALTARLSEDTQKIIQRIEYELLVISTMEFNTYFLIVEDFITWARDHGIAVGPGRGSAAGSIVAYCLGITNIEPLQYSLLFERFLNPSRISMPDIDSDFADVKRGEVLEYLRNKYGHDRVAGVATFGTLGAKQSIKDVGKVLGFTFQDMDKIAKTIPERPGMTIALAMEESPDFRGLYEGNKEYTKLIDIAKQLEGAVRHVSVHACAFVIAPDALTKYSAIQHPPKDKESVITQLSMKPIEEVGLVKMDLLGLKNLTLIQEAVELIRMRHDISIPIDTPPLDDELTYKLFARGDTTGVFQFESAGMKKCLRSLKPEEFEDLIAMVAMYRPGPMKFIPEYIDVKHGRKKLKFPHPLLEPVLRVTNGIAIYQEQILEMVQRYAGFSLGEADLLRRAIGKKIHKEIMEQKEVFIRKSQEQGHTEAEARFMYEEVIQPFADYGFNKSHAACYAFLAFQTGYLKAHYPTEFMAALLTVDEETPDRVIINIEECEKMKISILSPDINESFVHFTVTNEKEIRFGLLAIKGLGKDIVEAIIEERRQQGLFVSLEDFIERMPQNCINKKVMESLSQSGGFDRFGDRKALMDSIDAMLLYKKMAAKSANSNQGSLFGESLGDKPDKITLPNVTFANDLERLLSEKKVLGLYVSGHPLKNLYKYIKKKAVLINSIGEKQHGKSILLAGIISQYSRFYTKKKEAMVSFHLEDGTSVLPCVIFPRSLNNIKVEFGENDIVLLKGTVSLRDDTLQCSVDELKKINFVSMVENAKADGLYGPPPIKEIIEAREQETLEAVSVDITEYSKERLAVLKSKLAEAKGDCPLTLVFQGKELPNRFFVTEEALRELAL